MDRPLLGAALAATAAAAGLVIACGTTDSPAGLAVYSYDGCVDDPAECPGKKAFECAMGRIAARHGHCSSRNDCAPAEVPDAGGLEQDDCINSCIQAAVNSEHIRGYLEEARIEVRRYCASRQCAVQLNCPRPVNAAAECVDGGCVWTVGIGPDGGNDAGAVRDAGGGLDAGPRPDASRPVDASTPVDASSPADAGRPVDASTPVDAGTPVDASAPVDASVPDASVPVDAGAGADAGAPDSAAQSDAATPIDSGSGVDANDDASVPDAEAAPDSGAEVDAGGLPDGGSAD